MAYLSKFPVALEYRLALLPVALACLVYIVAPDHRFIFPDSREYFSLAETLARDLTFDSPRRTPGYPGCVAVANLAAGSHGYFLANSLFLYGIAVLAMKLGKIWNFSRWPWLIVFFCFSPGLLACATVPLTETAFTLCLLACVHRTASGRDIAGGLWLSLATLMRPISMFLFVPVSARVWWKRRSLGPVLLFAVAANLFPLAWTVRNYCHTGYVFYSTIGAYSNLYYKAGTYLAYKENADFEKVRARLTARLPETEDTVARDKAAQRLATEILRENFWGFCRWAPRNLLNFLLPDINGLLERLGIARGNRGTYDVLNRCGVRAAIRHYFKGNFPAAAITAVYLVYYALVTAMLPVGIWRLARRRQADALFFAIALTCYFAILPVGNLDWRFRVPVMPFHFLSTLAGISWPVEKFISGGISWQRL